MFTFSKGISGDQSAESLINTDVSGLEMAPTETPPSDGLALLAAFTSCPVFLLRECSSSSSSIQDSRIPVRQPPVRSTDGRMCCSSFGGFLMRRFFTIKYVSTLCSYSMEIDTLEYVSLLQWAIENKQPYLKVNVSGITMAGLNVVSIR